MRLTVYTSEKDKRSLDKFKTAMLRQFKVIYKDYEKNLDNIDEVFGIKSYDCICFMINTLQISYDNELKAHVFMIDTRKSYKGNKLTTLYQMITYGNLQTRGCQVFKEVFEWGAENANDYI